MKIFDRDNIRYISLMGQIGFIIISNILLCVFFYKIIEKYFVKSTILFIFFVLLGVMSGFYSVYKLIMAKK